MGYCNTEQMARVTTRCILFGNRNEGQRKAAVCHNDSRLTRELRVRKMMHEGQITKLGTEGPLWEMK